MALSMKMRKIKLASLVTAAFKQLRAAAVPLGFRDVQLRAPQAREAVRSNPSLYTGVVLAQAARDSLEAGELGNVRRLAARAIQEARAARPAR